MSNGEPPEVAWTSRGLMVKVPGASGGEWLEAAPEPRRWHDTPGENAVRLVPAHVGPIGDCHECAMPVQLVTAVHDDLNGEDCAGALGGSPWTPSALDRDHLTGDPLPEPDEQDCGWSTWRRGGTRVMVDPNGFVHIASGSNVDARAVAAALLAAAEQTGWSDA